MEVNYLKTKYLIWHLQSKMSEIDTSVDVNLLIWLR